MGGKGDNGISPHVPVMIREVIEYLDCRPGGIILDGTVGAGGHARGILPRILPDGFYLGLDVDKTILSLARRNLELFEKNVALEHGNFARLKELAARHHLNGLDGALFDLGLSSWQLNDPSRGFSFQGDGPLDMRMDRSGKVTAYQVVNRLPAAELAEIIYRYGNERWARRISRGIVRYRKIRPIRSTTELAALIARTVPGRGRIHPATRAFQALRIHINRELESLQEALPGALELLKPGGRICVIAFQSLEDRIVKHEFRRWEKEKKEVKILTPKPLLPSREEVRRNPRSRSAKLRVAEKI